MAMVEIKSISCSCCHEPILVRVMKKKMIHCSWFLLLARSLVLFVYRQGTSKYIPSNNFGRNAREQDLSADSDIVVVMLYRAKGHHIATQRLRDGEAVPTTPLRARPPRQKESELWIVGTG